jgi:hypothetical protein
MFAITNRIPPSQYRSPVTNAIAMVAPAPVNAAAPSSGFLRGARSATAPMTGSTNTVRNTDSDTRYGKNEPAATEMPSG